MKKFELLYPLLVKDEDKEKYDWWKDHQFISDLDHRAEALENGSDQGMTLAEFKAYYRL